MSDHLLFVIAAIVGVTSLTFVLMRDWIKKENKETRENILPLKALQEFQDKANIDSTLKINSGTDKIRMDLGKKINDDLKELQAKCDKAFEKWENDIK